MYYRGRSCEYSTSSYSRAAITWSACDSGHLLRVTHAPILSVSERDRNSVCRLRVGDYCLYLCIGIYFKMCVCKFYETADDWLPTDTDKSGWRDQERKCKK